MFQYQLLSRFEASFSRAWLPDASGRSGAALKTLGPWVLKIEDPQSQSGKNTPPHQASVLGRFLLGSFSPIFSVFVSVGGVWVIAAGDHQSLPSTNTLQKTKNNKVKLFPEHVNLFSTTKDQVVIPRKSAVRRVRVAQFFFVLVSYSFFFFLFLSFSLFYFFLFSFFFHFSFFLTFLFSFFFFLFAFFFSFFLVLF